MQIERKRKKTDVKKISKSDPDPDPNHDHDHDPDPDPGPGPGPGPGPDPAFYWHPAALHVLPAFEFGDIQNREYIVTVCTVLAFQTYTVADSKKNRSYTLYTPKLKHV